MNLLAELEHACRTKYVDCILLSDDPKTGGFLCEIITTNEPKFAGSIHCYAPTLEEAVALSIKDLDARATPEPKSE